jgi:hypothetical protein
MSIGDAAVPDAILDGIMQRHHRFAAPAKA